jgi:dolichol-phosphate mannosyltransferase
MLSKYTIVLLVPAVFVFILFSPRSMKWLARPQPYIAAFLALLLFSPVILWNADHNWASFVFQGPRRIKGSFDFSLFELLGYLVLLLTPAGLLSVVEFMLVKDRMKSRTWFKNVIDQKTLFVVIFTFIPFAVFLFFSLFRQVKLTWTAPVWLAFLPVMARTMTEIHPIQKGRFFPFLKRTWQYSILGSPLVLGAILYYAVLGFPGLPYYFKDSTFLLGWKSLAENIEQVKNCQEQIDSNPLIVGLDKYRIASGLAFYRKKAALEKKEFFSHGEVVETASRNLFGKNSLMYMFWYPAEQYAGRDMILVSDEPHDLMQKKVTQSFRSMDAIKKLSITKNNKPVRSYYYRLGYDFRPKYVCGPGKNTVTTLNKQLSCQVTSLNPVIFTTE